MTGARMSRSVLLITNAWPDTESSSHGVFIRRLTLDLAELGWRFHVLAPRIYRESLPRELHETHSVRRFPFFSAGKLLIEYESVPRFRLGCLLLSGTFCASAAMIRERFALVHAHWAFPAGLIALAVARLTGKPLLLTVHGSDHRLAAERGGAAAKAFTLAARGADRVLSVSAPISDYLLEIGVPAERIVTRPLGVDDRVFNPSVTPDPEFGDGFKVISTRNLLPLYRVEDLLRAAAEAEKRIPGLNLLVAGDGAERPRLEELGRELGLGGKLRFAGLLAPEKLASLLAASDVYVTASPSEGTSVSLLEALAVGSLPVAADIPSNRAWVEHGVNGLLFAPGDTRALAECLVRAAEDNALRERARTQGPAIVAERGLLRGHVSLTDSLYRELAGETAI